MSRLKCFFVIPPRLCKRPLIRYSLFVALCACGFAPMYSDGRRLSDMVADIYIAPIAGTNGIDLRNRLILAWNTANTGAEKYRLSVNLAAPATAYKALQRSGNATWEEVRITANWTLSQGERTISRSTETASESYSFVPDLVAANASRTTAETNAVNSIGDKIEMKVNAKLRGEI